MHIINDVLSDVYAFHAMRRTIVVGFNAITVAAIAYHLATIVPGIQPEMADAFALILGGSWRILLGTFASYVLGSLLNSYLMAGLKRRFDKYLVFAVWFSLLQVKLSIRAYSIQLLLLVYTLLR